MLGITFGEIKHGWAETFFDFGPTQQVATRLSWFTDPFAGLVGLALAMMRGNDNGDVRFTDEETDWNLRFQSQANGFYTLRLEHWLLGSSISARGQVTLNDQWETTDIEPWQFAQELWTELSRVRFSAGVRSWNEDRNAPSSPRNQTTASCDSLSQLARALAGDDIPRA